MKRIFFLTFLITFFVSTALFSSNVFNVETMYNGTGGASGDAISTHEANNRFENDALTMSGTGDMRTTSASVTTDYSSASGTYNVMLNAANEYFQISDINTASYSSLVLSFGIRKNTNAETGSTMSIQVSSDGASW